MVPQGTGRGGSDSTNINALKKVAFCHCCNKLGHWKRVCRSNPDRMQLDAQIQNPYKMPHNGSMQTIVPILQAPMQNQRPVRSNVFQTPVQNGGLNFQLKP